MNNYSQYPTWQLEIDAVVDLFKENRIEKQFALKSLENIEDKYDYLQEPDGDVTYAISLAVENINN